MISKNMAMLYLLAVVSLGYALIACSTQPDSVMGVRSTETVTNATDTRVPATLDMQAVTPSATISRWSTTQDSSMNGTPAIIVETKSNEVRLYSSFADPSRSRLDLDTGTVTGPENLTADVEFYTSEGSTVADFVKTVNGALAQIFYVEHLEFEDCLEHLDELITNLIPDYNVGLICILTNAGSLSYLEFNRSDLREGAEWVEFQFVTWGEVNVPE